MVEQYEYNHAAGNIISKTYSDYVYIAGCGNLDANIMFVGGTPEGIDVSAGEPFTKSSISGKVFRNMLKTLGLERDDVYITYSLGRECETKPDTFEINSRDAHLKEQLDTVRPLLIVPIGAMATSSFVGNIGITKVHGKLLSCERTSAKIYPIYHTSYYRAYASSRQRSAFKADMLNLKSVIKKMARKDCE